MIAKTPIQKVKMTAARELWQFSHVDGWQAKPSDHPLADFPIPPGDQRQPNITARMVELLISTRFHSGGLVTSVTGGVLVVHKSVSLDAPHWFFGWGMLLDTPLRVLFPSLPDVLEFTNQYHGADLGITFRRIGQ